MVGEASISGRLNRRRYTASRKQLERDVPALNLEQIEVQAVRPTEPSARVAADVTLYWPDDEDGQPGDQLPLQGLNEGEEVLVTRDTYIKLEKRSAARVPVWLALLILFALAIWAAVFGYLCFTA